MTMNFGSFEGLAEHLLGSTVVELHQVKRGLELSAERIEKTARDEIGIYQDAIAMFPEWAQLAESTEDEKARLGYPTGAPLLRTGELQDSMQHEVEEWEATVGSIDPVMLFHEFGTVKMPPRPVIGPALYQNLETIQRLIGNFAVSGLIGGDPIAGGLGYDIEGSAE